MFERLIGKGCIRLPAWRTVVLLWGLLAGAGAGAASLGCDEIVASADEGPITVYYPTDAPEHPVARGRLTLSLAEHAAPLRGNGRLVVISHGSGGSPWVHADLARALVNAGFVVALPEHHADNYRDDSRPGPESWSQRPAEVSRAIDAVAHDARFAPLLQLDKVGVYGMSAGGHTALTMAGAAGRRPCSSSIVKPTSKRTFKLRWPVHAIDRRSVRWLQEVAARGIIDNRFDDATCTSTAIRVAAVVAGGPHAEFDWVRSPSCVCRSAW